VLNHGRNRRFATPDQKLALRAMYRSCLFPGCDMPFDRCEQHHLVEYQHHGTTDLIDLGPVCVRHHHQLHAHNWKLRLHPDTRQLTMTYPDGTTRTHPLTRLTPANNDPPGIDLPGKDTPGIGPPITSPPGADPPAINLPRTDEPAPPGTDPPAIGSLSTDEPVSPASSNTPSPTDDEQPTAPGDAA
jgi:hypothetical protein